MGKKKKANKNLQSHLMQSAGNIFQAFGELVKTMIDKENGRVKVKEEMELHEQFLHVIRNYKPGFTIAEDITAVYDKETLKEMFVSDFKIQLENSFVYDTPWQDLYYEQFYKVKELELKMAILEHKQKQI